MYMCHVKIHVAYDILFSLSLSRDSRIRQLELELAAAPKQEKVERSVIATYMYMYTL